MNNHNFDNSLIGSLKEGDESAYLQIYSKYEGQLISYAYRIVNNLDEAKEVVHITFCKLWDNRNRLTIKESIKSYLYKAVYNNAVSKLRANNRFLSFTSQGLGDLYFNRIIQNPQEEMSLFDSETRKYIIEAINELPERCKEVFVKCKLEGASYKEAAELLDISVKTVENQIGIAHKKLRQKLDWLMIMLIFT